MKRNNPFIVPTITSGVIFVIACFFFAALAAPVTFLCITSWLRMLLLLQPVAVFLNGVQIISGPKNLMTEWSAIRWLISLGATRLNYPCFASTA